MDARSNVASSTSQTFATYSLVPYLGILFCPGAIVMGSIGLVRSYQRPQLGGRNIACTSMVAGSLVLLVQVFLWWILYQAPIWARGF